MVISHVRDANQWRQIHWDNTYHTCRSAFLFSASLCSFARRLSIAASRRCRFRSFFWRRRSSTCRRRLRQRASRCGSRRATASVSSTSRTIAASGKNPLSLSNDASSTMRGKSSRINPVDLPWTKQYRQGNFEKVVMSRPGHGFVTYLIEYAFTFTFVSRESRPIFLCCIFRDGSNRPTGQWTMQHKKISRNVTTIWPLPNYTAGCSSPFSRPLSP